MTPPTECRNCRRSETAKSTLVWSISLAFLAVTIAAALLLVVGFRDGSPAHLGASAASALGVAVGQAVVNRLADRPRACLHRQSVPTTTEIAR